METLRAAYAMAKQNDGAPGIDGVTFEAIEAQGVEALLEQLRDELTGCTYKPLPARKQEIPKDGGKVRVLSGQMEGRAMRRRDFVILRAAPRLAIARAWRKQRQSH